jgi:glutaminyl-tRNA synthetase
MGRHDEPGATVPGPNEKSRKPARDFIREIVEQDLSTGKYGGRVATRFPPEPNGYLHIGHAKSICLNFGIAREYGGRCNLRYDDTNPAKEEAEYVQAIEADVRWLGFQWDELRYASDYFEELYAFAEQLIRDGKAYVDELSPEELRERRGTLTEPGRDSPYRDRPPEESLELFRRMRAGEFEEGRYILRAKIDMASPNINLRDPTLYRIKKVPHHRTGDRWPIYPMYDYAHCLSDALEGITHSICTLEFEDHRPLYEWVLEQLVPPPHPRQIEFARLNLTRTVLSKRKLLALVQEGHVRGWDDPRMPTLSGMRRRGYTPEAIRSFCERIGVAKRDSRVDIRLLEHCVREDLNRRARRLMAVLRPLRVVLDNWPEGKVEEVELPANPEDPSLGTRRVPLSRVLLVDREDFREEPPPKYYRLAPGRTVRLRGGFLLRCERVAKDPDTGEVTELGCTIAPGPEGKDSTARVTIHWVSEPHALSAEVRLYDYLFLADDPEDARTGGDWRAALNPNSLVVIPDARIEPSAASAQPGDRFQFERVGYFSVDPDSQPGQLVFNLTVSLKDAWAKLARRTEQGT